MAENNYVEIIRNSLINARNSILIKREHVEEVGINRFNDTIFSIDLESEKVIIDEFRKSRKGFTIISEETGRTDVNGGGTIVVVDPLDGSNNAIRGIPFYSVSIAIANGNKVSDIVASGIINVINGDIIFADEQNVFFNQKISYPSKTTNPDLAIATIVPRLHSINDQLISDNLLKLLRHIRYPRFLGSAAMESAFVSVGLLDAFIELFPRLRVVDLAASLHMARIAGVYVRLLNIEGELDLMYNGRISCVIASNSGLGKSIINILK